MERTEYTQMDKTDPACGMRYDVGSGVGCPALSNRLPETTGR